VGRGGCAARAQPGRVRPCSREVTTTPAMHLPGPAVLLRRQPGEVADSYLGLLYPTEDFRVHGWGGWLRVAQRPLRALPATGGGRGTADPHRLPAGCCHALPPPCHAQLCRACCWAAGTAT